MRIRAVEVVITGNAGQFGLQVRNQIIIIKLAFQLIAKNIAGVDIMKDRCSRVLLLI